MNSRKPSLVWFRKNLRMEDNRVLAAALVRGTPLIPVFIWDNSSAIGRASQWWLRRTLQSFQKEFSARGACLILQKGDPLEVLKVLVRETKADAIFWDRAYEPVQRKQDDRIRAAFNRQKVICHSISDALLFDPATIRTKQGTPFKVFTAFWNHCSSLTEPLEPVRMSKKWPLPSRLPRNESLDDLTGTEHEWTKKLERFWKPGSQGANRVWKRFLKEELNHYIHSRDKPAMEGTSRISPHLHFGEISVRRIWKDVRQSMARYREPGFLKEAEAFLRQIVWREFAYYLLFYFPETVDQPLRKEFSGFAWRNDKSEIQSWQEGMTGYPIVDAGMRELWATGWMHNRVRMIVASFLVKDLLQSWQKGAHWFWDTLVDADLANNTFGWQWTAGCGADAAPYFRIFNPVLQGEKFDPDGIYVRRWVPEIYGLPNRYIHKPWQAPEEVLLKASVNLGKKYPLPIVDHDAARKRALFAFDRFKRRR